MSIRSASLILVTFIFASVLVLGPRPSTTAAQAVDGQPNIMLLIADDFGVESSVCYDELPAPAPRIEAFCESAVVYDNAWSSPVCSPTRAGILTGRHSFRTGIGEQVVAGSGQALGLDEYTLPEVLDLTNSGYATANFGKWHLGGNTNRPTTMGWNHFSGLLAGGLPDYENWTKVTNGTSATETKYATTANVDDALAWIDEQNTPWLTWIGFNAPHVPFHEPPADLHTQNLNSDSTNLEKYSAAVEALDTEIGRLVDSLDPAVRDNTVFVFVGDNGTPTQVSDFADTGAKGSIQEGGVHVPLIVWGAGVDGGRRSDALVGTVDIFSTVLELAGVDPASVIPSNVQLDSVSFAATFNADVETNEYLLSEVFGSQTAEAQQGKTIRNGRYKLIEFADGRTEFYDLLVDRQALTTITAADRTAAEQASFDELSTVLAEWTASVDAPRPMPDVEPPATPTPAPLPDDGALGDVDCSSIVTGADALVIAQYVAGSRTSGACQHADPISQIALDRGDYDADGTVNNADAQAILRCLVGFECAASNPEWIFDSTFTLAAVAGCPIVGTFLDVSQFDGAGAAYDDPTLAVTCSGATFTVASNGIPHTTFVQLTPLDLQTQAYSNEIPLTPVLAASPIQIGADDGASPTLGRLGVAINGMPFFGPTEAAQPDAFGDPLTNGIIDDCGGHHFSYHYHAMVTSCFAPDWDDSQPSPIVGYAYDGYPIYGSTGCLDASCAEVVEFKSGWVVTGDLSTYAWDNVTFVADQGADFLDSCNGRVQPDGSYGYHVTSTFPYIVGCFVGEVNLPPLGGGG